MTSPIVQESPKAISSLSAEVILTAPADDAEPIAAAISRMKNVAPGNARVNQIAFPRNLCNVLSGTVGAPLKISSLNTAKLAFLLPRQINPVII